MARLQVAVGIDIGGTNTVFGLVDENGKAYTEGSIPTRAQEPATELLKRLKVEIDRMAESHPELEIVGIGVGAPNANYYKGTVEHPPNLNWHVVNVVDLLKTHYPKLPSAITNDANAAAIGELKFGAGKGLKHFIVITLGTGLGSGLIVDGNLVYGHDGFAGEIGHTIYDPNGRECGCGRKGCLETYASASGIKRTVYELMGTTRLESSLRKIPFEALTSRMIRDAAAQGDALALEAFDRTARILGLKLADSVAYTSPEAIILFGGLAHAGDVLFKPVKKYMEENMLNIFKNKVKILPSGLTEGNTAVLGASALIWNEIHQAEKNKAWPSITSS